MIWKNFIHQYKILEWDSEVFGFNVAKIMPDSLGSTELEEILNDLKKKNVSLVYWSFHVHEKRSRKAAEDMGGFLTGQKITYISHLENMPEISLDSQYQPEEYSETIPDGDLINLILQGAVYSRFYVDPRISKKQYENLHKLWIANSVRNSTIFVFRKNNRIIGFVSLNEKDNRGNIDFIVVDKLFRGQGIGKCLLSHAHKWLILNGYDIVQAVTQKENIVSCKLYEKYGYHPEKTENFYHFWIVPPE